MSDTPATCAQRIIAEAARSLCDAALRLTGHDAWWTGQLFYSLPPR